MRSASICDSLIEDSTMPMILLGNHAHGKFLQHEVYRASPEVVDNRPPSSSSTASSSSSTLLPYSTSTSTTNTPPHLPRGSPLLSLRKTWATAVSNLVSAFQSRHDKKSHHRRNHHQKDTNHTDTPSLPPPPAALLAQHSSSPYSKSEIFISTQIEINTRPDSFITRPVPSQKKAFDDESGGYSRCSSLTILGGPPRRLRALATPRYSPFRKSMVFEEVVAS